MAHEALHDGGRRHGEDPLYLVCGLVLWGDARVPAGANRPVFQGGGENADLYYSAVYLRAPGGYQQDVPGRHYGKYSEKDADSAPRD